MFGIFKKTKKQIDFAEHGADIAQAMATLVNEKTRMQIANLDMSQHLNQKEMQVKSLKALVRMTEERIKSCERALIRSDNKFDNAVKAARKHKATIRHLQASIECGENELRQSDCFIADLKKANHDLSERNKILEQALNQDSVGRALIARNENLYKEIDKLKGETERAAKKLRWQSETIDNIGNENADLKQKIATIKDPEKLAEFKHSTKIAFEEIRSLIKQSKCSLSALSIIKTRLFGN